jgi:hypothetical protein
MAICDVRRSISRFLLVVTRSDSTPNEKPVIKAAPVGAAVYFANAVVVDLFAFIGYVGAGQHRAGFPRRCGADTNPIDMVAWTDRAGRGGGGSAAGTSLGEISTIFDIEPNRRLRRRHCLRAVCSSLRVPCATARALGHRGRGTARREDDGGQYKISMRQNSEHMTSPSHAPLLQTPQELCWRFETPSNTVYGEELLYQAASIDCPLTIAAAWSSGFPIV